MRIAQAIRSIRFSTEQVSLALLFGLGAIHIPGHANITRPIRWGLLIVLAVCIVNALIFNKQRQALLKTIPARVYVPTALLTLSVIWSSVVSKQDPISRFVGFIPGEFLGLSTWLAFIILGLLLKDHVLSFIQSRTAVYVALFLIAVSLLYDASIITYGFRFAGLLAQSTSMGMYCVIGLLLGLWHLGSKERVRVPNVILVLLITVSIVGIFASQSRIAHFSALLVVILLLLNTVKSRVRSIKGLLAALVLLLVIPMFAASHFQRLASEQVGAGVSYRMDIYKTTLDGLAREKPIIGLGPGIVVEELNSRNMAPANLVETLDEGFIFLSAHDIFLDIFVYFGLLGLAGFLALFFQAIYYMFVRFQDGPHQLLGLLFLIVLANALISIPTLEMTALLFVTMFGALAPKYGLTRLASSRKAVTLKGHS